MGEFIKLGDYDASVHREILDALTRSDEAIIEICEDRAITEMKGFLAKRYDVKKVFESQGGERNPLVLMMAIDIAVYHLFSIHNPQKIAQIRIDRYKRAIDWLKGIRSGEEDVDGLPELEDDKRQRSDTSLFKSNPKKNYFI